MISAGVDKNVVTHRHVRWEGASALGAAAYEGQMEIVRYLVDIGTSVNFCDPCQKRTPLHWACLGNQYQAATYLVTRGADVNHRDLEQTTPLLRAVLGKNVDLVRYLRMAPMSVTLTYWAVLSSTTPAFTPTTP